MMSYRELTSDEEVLSDVSDVDPSPQATVRSSARVQRRTYNEDSSSSDESSSASESPDDPPVRRTTPSASRRRKRPTTTIPSKSVGRFPSYKKRKTSTIKKTAHSKAEAAVQLQPPSGRIPPWQDLEFSILCQILRYASYPLYENVSQPRPSIQWLLEVSLLSKSFHAAAVAALLHSPPLYPAVRAHGLLKILQQDQETLSTNYQTKIRRLDVETKNLLIKKSGVALADLIRHTPLLKVLNIYHNHDLFGSAGGMWALPSAMKHKWFYPTSLFEALDGAKIELKGFSWNGRFPETKSVLEGLDSLHQRLCFRSLQSLSLLNLRLPEKATPEETQHCRRSLATGVLHLSQLQELAFEKCHILDDAMLALLPHGLRQLSISNCGHFTSAGLHKFLQSHGSGIERLSLMCNQAMDLGFMPGLAELCPHLQVIEADLTYTDPSSFHDIEPHYDELLPNGQPTWPKSLRIIDFANLRNLDAGEADDFLQSLVNASQDLKDLRRLSLKALLKIGWRDRANLRSKWQSKLDKVFLRKSLPPQQITSMPPKWAPQALQTRVSQVGKEKKSAPDMDMPLSDNDASGSAGPTRTRNATNSRKSKRIAQKEFESLNSPADDEDTTPEELVQGFCDTVVFSLDNQRPAESQFTEGDFLDSEQSGDEDWTGRPGR